MGGDSSKTYNSILMKPFKKIKGKHMIMLGLDGAGKTTIFYKCKVEEYSERVPIIGMNVEVLEFATNKFTTWDVGGEDKIRAIFFPYYFHKFDGFVYVVDANDKERISEARDEFYKILSFESFINQPVLIFLNKQDLPNALNVDEFSKRFKLDDRMKKDHLWRVQPTCATSGEGLYEGFDWLSNSILFGSIYTEIKKIWKLGWTFEVHDVFPIKFKRLVWSMLLICIKNEVIFLPKEIGVSIMSYFDPMGYEGWNDMSSLVKIYKKKKLFLFGKNKK